MGIRSELFSTRVQLPKRTYFFNIKENRNGDLYLNLVESKDKEVGSGFERQSVILFADDLSEFLKGFDEALKVLDKAQREKNKGAPRSRIAVPAENRGDGDRGRPPVGTRGDRGHEGAPGNFYRDRQGGSDERYNRGSAPGGYRDREYRREPEAGRYNDREGARFSRGQRNDSAAPRGEWKNTSSDHNDRGHDRSNTPYQDRPPRRKVVVTRPRHKD
jgi:hypothetical protein